MRTVQKIATRDQCLANNRKRVIGGNEMFHYDYKTKYTCSRLISMDLEGDKVYNVVFTGGCNGNLKAIPALIDGWSVEEIEKKLTGITCGERPTSCGDQLAKAVREAYNASKETILA